MLRSMTGLWSKQCASCNSSNFVINWHEQSLEKFMIWKQILKFSNHFSKSKYLISISLVFPCCLLLLPQCQQAHCPKNKSRSSFRTYTTEGWMHAEMNPQPQDSEYFNSLWRSKEVQKILNYSKEYMNNFNFLSFQLRSCNSTSVLSTLNLENQYLWFPFLIYRHWRETSRQVARSK